MPDLLPPPVINEKEARRLYVERSAGIYTTNNFLKLSVAGLVVVTLILAVGLFHAEARAGSVKPFVFNVNRHGGLDPVELDYKPTKPVLQHFLLTFTTLHYSRIRATVRNDFEHSLYFLNGPLASAAVAAERKPIETFLAQHGEEVEVKVSNIAIEEEPGPIYRAVVDYEKIYLREGREERRERYLGRFTFVTKEDVPFRLIPVNPLGLTIVNMSENRAFEDGK